MSLKNRIILTFSLLTALLVAVLAWVSYVAVKEIYLAQLADQTELLTRLAGNSLDARYLAFVEGGESSQRAVRFYNEKLTGQIETMRFKEALIFDETQDIVARANSHEHPPENNAQLLLYLSDIQQLAVGQTRTTLPFRSRAGEWYLWGFYRLNARHWLGIRESAERFAQLQGLTRTFWAIGLIGLAVTILAGIGLARSIARPIERLVRFSEQLGKGDFEARVPETGQEELAILGTAMERMREDLSQHSREKEAMLAQIAHEIRNPLGGIELLAGLVKEDLLQHEVSPAYIDKILLEITGLKSLINAYLNYSRPATAVPEEIHLDEVVAEVSESLRHKVEQKKARLNVALNGESLQFDRQHLRQVLFNLLNNSVAMIEEGGQINIRTDMDHHMIRLSVDDNGPGIPEANMAKIFNPFFTTRDDGTGLGLAISRKLCRENGAELTVKNGNTRGCIFTLTQKVVK